MKTFTNYAEKKAKQFLNLLQGYTKGIRITAILILLLMGVSNVWGGNNITFQSGAFFYFDPYYSTTQTVDKGYIQLAARKYQNSGKDDYGWYTAVTTLTKIANTRLYYTSTFEGPAWTDNGLAFHGWAMISNSTAKGNGSTEYWTGSNSTWYSEFKNYGLNKNSTYLFVATSASKGQSIQPNGTGYLSGGYSALNSTQTIKTAVNGVDANSKATITVTSYKLTGNGTISAQQSASINTSAQNTTISAARTATTTLTVGSVTAGYKFDGWYTAATGGTQLSTSTTYTYYPTAATTVYARFSTIKYTVNFGVHSSGNGTLTAKAGSTSINSGANVNYGSNVVFTASPSTGYRIQGWYSDANCTTSLNNSTQDTYSVTVTTGTNVYVKYEEIPEEKFAVTIQTNNANYGTVSPSGPQQVGASGIEIEATAKYGYKFDQWTKTGSVTIEDTSDPTTVIKATGTGTVTATFVEDLATTKWYISGNGNGSGNDLTPGSPFTGWATNGIQMFKKSGHSTEEIYYCTITANTIASSDDHFPFKVYNATTSKYWGNSGYWVTKENNSPTLSSSSGDNMKFRPYLVGTYEFKLDATNASSPVLTVTWPVYNQLRISAANPADATNTGEFDMTGSGTYTVTRSLKANTTYTFKIVYNSDWYGVNSGNLTRASATKTLNTSGGDLTIKTDVAGNYTFTFNGSTKALTVTYPPAYTVTYGVGTNKGTEEVTTNPSISSGSLVLASTSITFSKGDTKAGYTWKNWNSKADGTGANLGTEDTYVSSNRAGDITVYACYDLITYNITYNTNGGTNPNNAQTSYNVTTATFNLPTPTKTGYTFAGWYTTSDFSGNNVTQITNGSTDHKEFWAKWTPDNYTITYKDQGGEGFSGTHENEYPTTHTYNTPTTLKGATRIGYDFGGWFTTIDCSSEKVTILGATDYTNEVTLYAKWLPKTYTITLDPQEGTGGTLSVSVTSGGPLSTIDVPSREAYNFGGYYDAEGGQGTQYYKPDGTSVKNWDKTTDATLYAHWIPTEYNITYELNGGTNHASNPKTYNITQEITLQDPTYTGHIFKGWFDNADFTGDAILSISAGSTGAKTFYAKWDVASYTINFDLEGGTGETTTELTVQYGAQLPDITIPTKAGYLFLGYYNGDNGTGTQYYDASGKGLKTMPANNLTLHAKWLNGSDCIFFYNNLGWSNVYVYFYSSDKYWDDSKGTGSKKEQIFPQEGDADHKPHYYEYRGKMTKIEGTNIWYYNYSVHSDIKIYNYTSVAFTKDQQYNYEFFHKTEVVRRGDFNSNVPMFVSMKADKVTKNESSYYNYGYWMNYPTNTGYTLKIYNKVKGDGVQEWRSIPFEYSEDMMMPLTLSVSGMESGKTYGFKILRADNTWYGNSGTMTTNSSGDVGQTAWEFTKEVNDNCGLTTTAAGTYVFTLKYGKDRNSNYNYLVGVEYPASVGDYRLAYKDNTHPFHPGHLLKKRDGKDTVSFFVHHAQNLSPVIMLQEVTKIDAQTGDITWNTISTTKINGIGATGIYNFILEQSGNAATLLNTITEYTGDFYIRTDATAGGWGNFRQNSNKMTYTSYAENQDFGFNHYFVEWINAGTNVKFTIANEYSYCLSDSLNADGIVTDGNLPANANVRFGWNSKTNQLSRAYISGSSNVAERYLVLTGDDKLTDMDNQNFNIDGLHQHEAIFQDMGNWIYQLDAKAGRGASIQLTARYNGKDQTFFNTSAVALAEEGNETTYPVRFIYDFKTNNLMAAWLLENDKNHIQGGNDLNANMLLLRRHHNQAQQIQLTHKLSKVGTAYGVMTFEKDFVNDTEKSIYERALYWVSFPFDVRIRDVFGFGEYMDTWIMEYYDGEARAKNGAWVDSESYWTYITDLDYVLKAGVGYVLCLDLDKMGADSKVFENTSEVSLYFPSAKPIGNIDVEQAVSDTLKALPCSIERDKRNIYDSNWHVIGVPRFINLNITLDGGKIYQQNVVYYYQYNASNNTYLAAVNSGKQTFQTMQAYMVQYAGIIDWWEMVTWETPQQIAARRNADSGPEKVSLNLELAQDDLTADKTFIQLQEEGATADFDMNKDLTKIINAGANIYTLVGEGNIQTAGNVLPMGECEVPVGVKVEAAGEYTFRMPDGTEGMVVELIDYYTNTRTNLLLFDYTVDLSAGTCNDRFALHIQPSKSGVTTGIEGAYPQPLPEGKGTKFLIDGKLIIRTAEGEVFDAQGHRL